jgi:hypothetical protein
MLGKYDAGPFGLLPSAGGSGAVTRCAVMGVTIAAVPRHRASSDPRV